MKKFFSWFKSEHKVKRWILLALISVVLICWALSTIFVTDTLDIKTIVKIAVLFIFGFAGVIVSYVSMQKQTLENMVKQTDNRDNVKSLIYNKKVYSQGPKIVVIGGGNAINAVLRGLKKYTDNITAVVSVNDYGIKDKDENASLRIAHAEDVKESIIALAKNESETRKLLEHKFTDENQNSFTFGELYLQTMEAIHSDFATSVEKSKDIFNIAGKVLPVSKDKFEIYADLSDGSVAKGRAEIPKKISEKYAKINRVYISPSNSKALPAVIEAINEADAIVIGPGSLYTSIIPNLLVKGVSKALKDSKAFKVYISNIMTEPGETYNYSLSDHIKAIKRHIGEGLIDYCIYDTGDIIPEYIRKYNSRGADVIDQDIQKAKAEGVKLIKRDLATIENKYIRHNPDALAEAIIELVCEDMRFKDKQNDPEYLILNHKLKYKKLKSKDSPKWEKQKLNKDGKSKFYSKYEERISSIKESNEITKRKIITSNKNNQLLERVNGMRQYNLPSSKRRSGEDQKKKII